MSFLSNIGGMLPAAYAGFNKGVDDVTARQQREADAKYQEEQRARARSMAPLEDEARTSRLKASLKQDEISGLEDDINQSILKDKQGRLPQLLTDAAIKSDVTSAGDRIAGTQKLMELGGQALATGDSNGLNLVFKHLISSGAVQMPDGSPIPPPVRSDVVNAPKGSIDFVGQPIEGRAIKATMPDGSSQYVPTKFMEDAYKRKAEAADLANIKPIKPGENLVNVRTGQLVAQGQPRLSAGGYIDPETGEFVPTRAATGAGGTGSRSGGKAAASPQSAAVGFFATAAEKAETKLTPTQIAYGQRLAEQIATQRSESGQPIPPAIAAEVAMEVALDPAKIQPQVNVQTGKIEGVFSRRDLGDVVVEPWSPALQRSFTPEQLGKAAEELVKAQPAAVREEFLAAAHDPAARKTLVEKVTQEIATKVPTEQVQAYTQSTLASLTEKLDIVSKNTKPPKANDSPRRSLFSIGGMAAPESYSPRAGVPDDLARRAAQANDAARQRATEQAARSAAESKASEERKAELEQEISWLTEAEVRAMSPSEAAGYLRKYESVLSSDLQRALRRRQ